MQKKFISTSAIFGALAVILGAFGAHALKKNLSPEQLQVFETAVRYQFYHVFALLATGILYKEYGSKKLMWAGRLFIAGIVLFSGSLYALTFLPENMKWIGVITPFGGLCFIVGWLFLGAAVLKKEI
ncbi:MAG: DUF423 domain-containing protein [Ferruginibacter sp.]